MSTRFAQFIKERRYITNVSPATIEWYEQSFALLDNNDAPNESDLKDFVIRMRERGLKATGVNCRARAINAYLHWASGATGKCRGGCQHLHVPKMKEPQLVLPTFTADQVKLIVRYKPKGKYQVRLHLLVLVLLDTGCRISEALGLHANDIDLDNLLVLLDGKGRKQRRVPFSFELRKHLSKSVASGLIFATRHGDKLDKNIVRRDVKLMCEKLGFKPPARTLHAFRHTFAVNYLRKGNSVFHLQKMLGHSTLEMTRRYANLMTEDLQAVHQRGSLLVV